MSRNDPARARRARVAERPRAIADIAIESGFYDQSHFTAAFRRRFGATPRAFRRAMRIPS